MRLLFLCGSLLLSLGLCSLAQAALLVYEPFDYTTGNLNGTNPNTSTVGLNTGTAYSAATGTPSLVVGSGLSFSNLVVTGNGLSLGPAAGRVSAVPFAGLPTVTGTIWNSFIINMVTRGGGATDGMHVRVTNDNSTSANRYSIFPVLRNGTSNHVGASYDDSGGGTSPAPSSAGGALTLGTTYLFLTKINNIGATNLAAGTGSMTTYVLTETQFDNFIASGRDEAFLSTTANVSFTVSDTNNIASSANNLFANGNFLSIVSVQATGIIDEIRYGQTLADVTPIPEPTTWAMALGGLGLVWCWRKRRCS